MNINEINTIANTLGKPVSKNFLSNIKVSMEGENGLGSEIDGSFTYIYNAVKDGKVKLLTKNDQVVGINFDAGVDNIIDDNRLGMIFNEHYKFTADTYVKTAMSLVATNAVIGSIIEYDNFMHSVYITLPQDKVAINVYGDIIAKADEMLYYIEDIENNLKNKVQAYMEGSRDNCSSNRVELPTEVEIPFDELDEDLSNKSIKSYLRNNYDHYLSGDYDDPDVDIDSEKEVVYVTNIHWGRKK